MVGTRPSLRPVRLAHPTVPAFGPDADPAAERAADYSQAIRYPARQIGQPALTTLSIRPPYRATSVSLNMTDTPEYTPPQVWVWEKDEDRKSTRLNSSHVS